MRGEQLELDGIAREVRRLGGATPDEIVSGPELAERVLKTRIRVAPTLRTAACLAFDGASYRILLREIADDTNFDCAHELSHYALRTIGQYIGPDEERLANALAATLLAPHAVVCAMVQQHGSALEAIDPLADHVQISQTAAHLRLGEILGDERAILTGRNRHRIVRTRGAFGWAHAPLVSVARDERNIKGLVKVRLRGGIDEGRVAFLKR